MTDEALAGGVDAPAVPSGAPIDADAVSTPHALGSQIPPKPEPVEPEADKPAKSAGEAIRRANEALKAKEAAAPKIEPKEPVKVEAKTDPKPEAKVEPVKTPAVITAPQAKPAEPAAQPEQVAKPIDPNSPHREAPARFSADAKTAWETAPEPVKAEVHRAIRELEQGHQKYKADSERFDKVREYDDLARQNGREGVHESLKQVVELERAFERNPIEGFQKVADHFGLSLRAVAAHIMGQTPDQVQGQQDSTIASLKQELAGLKQQLGGIAPVVQQYQTSQDEKALSDWSADKPHFAQLRAEITEYVKQGIGPDEAYQMAVNDFQEKARAFGFAPAPAPNPAASSATAASPAPLNPAGQKSISGAPATGSDPASRKSGPVPSIRESLNRAKRNLG